jgi:hypothetical protein
LPYAYPNNISTAFVLPFKAVAISFSTMESNFVFSVPCSGSVKAVRITSRNSAELFGRPPGFPLCPGLNGVKLF